ncbi:hypothetical protein, partial [Catenovulum sediminis]
MKYNYATSPDKHIHYNAKGKVKEIIIGSNPNNYAANDYSERFKYSPDGELYWKETRQLINGQPFVYQTHYAGSYEKKFSVNGGNQVYESVRIGGDIELRRSTAENGSQSEYYLFLHKNYLGSVIGITDMAGNIVSQLAYESFGQRRSPTDAESLKQAVNEALMQNLGNITEDGFTGH